MSTIDIDPATLAYVAAVFRDVARAGGTHINDDVGTSTGAELSPAACEAAARFVERLGARQSRDRVPGESFVRSAAPKHAHELTRAEVLALIRRARDGAERWATGTLDADAARSFGQAHARLDEAEMWFQRGSDESLREGSEKR